MIATALSALAEPTRLAAMRRLVDRGRAKRLGVDAHAGRHAKPNVSAYAGIAAGRSGGGPAGRAMGSLPGQSRTAASSARLAVRGTGRRGDGMNVVAWINAQLLRMQWLPEPPEAAPNPTASRLRSRWTPTDSSRANLQAGHAAGHRHRPRRSSTRVRSERHPATGRHGSRSSPGSADVSGDGPRGRRRPLPPHQKRPRHVGSTL